MSKWAQKTDSFFLLSSNLCIFEACFHVSQVPPQSPADIMTVSVLPKICDCSFSSGISHGAPCFTCIPEHPTTHRTLAEILLLLSKRKGFRSSGLGFVSHLTSLVDVHHSDLQDCYVESWFSSCICLVECFWLILVSWTCLCLQSLQIKFEFSPSHFIGVLPSVVSSANVINTIYIPASWSSSRYSLFRKMKIFSLEPDLGLTSAKPHLMYPFTVKNESLITTH